MTQTLADCAVVALAEVRAIGESMDNNHPMRHAVRSTKQIAEQILTEAFRKATELSYQAKQIVKDHDRSLNDFAQSIKEST